MKIKRWLDGGLLVLCSVFLLAFGIALIVSPKKSFSEEENRALSVWRTPTVEEALDGSLGTRLSTFCADQFPLRTKWVTMKARGERLLWRGENHGILFGKDGYLIDRDSYESLSVAEKNLRAMDRFGKESPTPVTAAFVPRAVDVMRNKLPTGYDASYTEEIWELIEKSGVSSADLRTPLREAADKGTEVFYRTDHHWTGDGVYLGYEEICSMLGIEPFVQLEFSQEKVSNSFFGSSDSASGGMGARSDRILLYRYEEDGDFLIEGETGKLPFEGFYDWSALENKNQYDVFLGGNHGYLTVSSGAQSARERLLLVKDSFSNSLIPLLARHYDLVVIDPRYYEGSFEEVLQTANCDRVLILWGADTLATDPSLGRFLNYGAS